MLLTILSVTATIIAVMLIFKPVKVLFERSHYGAILLTLTLTFIEFVVAAVSVKFFDCIFHFDAEFIKLVWFIFSIEFLLMVIGLRLIYSFFKD